MTGKPDSMRNRTTTVILIVIVALMGLIAWYVLTKKPRPVRPPVQHGCVDETREITGGGGDPHMTGALVPGQTYRFLMNFYKCNKPRAGDIVLYRFSSKMDPIVRIVRAAEGDKFELAEDKKHGAWNLKVNGDFVTYNGEPYYFGGATKPTLALYEKERNNILGPGETIVLANVPPGKDDSGMFGLVHKDDLIGKMETANTGAR
jgi:hypothetical protein